MGEKSDDKSDKFDKFSVEQSLKKLESYVEALDGGEVDLDQAFQVFENAVKLSAKLRKKLESYERKIEIITHQGPGDVGKEEFPQA